MTIEIYESATQVYVAESGTVSGAGLPGPQGPGGAAGAAGAAGPAGPTGPAGSNANASYIHVQSTVSSTWVIPHNLGFVPSVTVVDSAGTHVEGDFTVFNSTTVTVVFAAAFSGTAYLS